MTAMASSPLACYRHPQCDLALRHGSALVGTLRRRYGDGFARGYRREQSLAEILSSLDEASLLQVAKDFEHGRLMLASTGGR